MNFRPNRVVRVLAIATHRIRSGFGLNGFGFFRFRSLGLGFMPRIMEEIRIAVHIDKTWSEAKAIRTAPALYGPGERCGPCPCEQQMEPVKSTFAPLLCYHPRHAHCVHAVASWPPHAASTICRVFSLPALRRR
jgi:hypothetical protein